MNNLIFCAVAFKPGYENSVNISLEGFESAEMYLKNAFVSLKSIKTHNPDDSVCIFINFNMPEYYKKLFESNDIKIYFCEYKNFRFPPNFKWSLAFYKLCALSYAVNNLAYDNYLLLDTDTYNISEISDLWYECKDNILLFNMDHCYSNKQNIQMRSEFYKLYGYEENITNYGGEFICGNRELLKQFIELCKQVYEEMISKNVQTIHGDEFIINCIANKNKIKIKSANAYVFRFWTGNHFYLVSTNFIFNQINILHLPDEKNLGMIYIFNYYKKYKKLPSNERITKIFGLPKAKRPITWISFYIRVYKKLKKLTNKG